MDLKPNYIRITNYNKLIDRFITVQAKKATDTDKEKMGKLFALVEILGPWHPNSQIGQTIINTLTREYYKQSNTSEYINFQNALKKVNEKLVQITQNGETDWIGKINACLILICAGKMHFAHTGKIKGYLLRENKLMPIIDTKDSYSYTHPLKTFSSVISGEIKLSDRIFFSTNLLFDYINNKNLENLLAEKNIADSSTQIANILKTRNNKLVNCLLISLDQTNENPNQIPEVIYLDEEHFSYALKSAQNTFGKFLVNIKNNFKKAHHHFKTGNKYFQEKVLPQSKDIWNKTRDFTAKNIKNLQKKSEPLIQKIKDGTSQNEPKTKPQTANFNVNYYNKSSKQIVLFFSSLKDNAKKLFKKTKEIFVKLFSHKYRSRTLIGIAIILLVIFIINIGYLHNKSINKESQLKQEENITQLENKKDEITLSMLANDQTKAQKLINELESDLKNFSNTKLSANLQEKITAIKNDISAKKDEIAKITRLSSSVQIAKFSNIDQFFIVNDYTYALNKNTNQIFKAKDESKENPQEITQIPNSYGLAKTAKQSDTNSIFVYTYQKNIYALENDNLYKQENSKNTWANADILGIYKNNLYLLDASGGQIYKYTAGDNNYSDPQEYLDPAAVDVKNALDMAIDGNVYVLKQNGTVVKLTLGDQTDFTLKNIPAPNNKIADPKKIITNENLDSIYILDGLRVLEFNKDGEFQNQYAFSDDIKEIKDFYVSGKEIYILSNNTVYKFTHK